VCSSDLLRDFSAVEDELILADLELVEKRLERMEEARRKGKPPDEAERKALLRCKEILDAEQPLRHTVLTPEELKATVHLQFVSAKPLLPVVNVAEADLSGSRREALEKAFAERLARYPEHNRPTALFCSAKIEMEIAQLPPEEAAAFLADLGITESARVALIRASYALLGLISFLTAGEDECRAWTIPSGLTAQKAAGKVHSDIERGFIRAETVSFEDFITAGGDMNKVKAAGQARLEGKTYVVRDGDIINFKFNV
jgi:GTP-binding protein YchF